MWKPIEIEDEASEYVPYRCRGRPYLKWDSGFSNFDRLHLNESWQDVCLARFEDSMDVSIHKFRDGVIDGEDLA